MACEHVREQAHRVRDRPQEEREHFDEHDQRQDEDRNAAWYKQFEELQAVLVEAVNQHGEEHQKCQRRRDDDVARNRKPVGNDAEDVGNGQQHEDRKHQREELHAFLAGVRSNGGGDEFVAQFGDRLDASGYHPPSGHAADHQQRNQRDRAEHVGRRIGEGDLLIADMANREELADVELFDRIDHPRISWSAGHAGALQSIGPAFRPSGGCGPVPRLPISPR